MKRGRYRPKAEPRATREKGFSNALFDAIVRDELPEAPNGTMDFLFTQTLPWGRAEGYRWFNFGVAALIAGGVRAIVSRRA